MTIREQLIQSREEFFKLTAKGFQELAHVFGFPNNPGMPTHMTKSYYWTPDALSELLSVRKVRFPPNAYPENYFEVFLGTSPKPTIVPRLFYESNKDGFYSFYIENYKNNFYLPNIISEFLQIHCNFCVDISFLEIFREVTFATLVTYYYMISFRIFLAWLISINPYTFPLAYFIAFIDWVEESGDGFIPFVGGLGLATPLLSVTVGKVADFLNHIVFTMPYLPKEGVPGMALVKGNLKHVLMFRDLPFLWYKYPIPDDIREFWYTERPDILKYMQESYKDFDIQFLPDRIVNQLNMGETSLKEISFNSPSMEESASNLMISTNFDLIHHLNHLLPEKVESSLSFLSHLTF